MMVDWYISKDGKYPILLQVCNTVKMHPLHDVNKEIALTGSYKYVEIGRDSL